MSLLDTSPTAEAIQAEVQRKLSGVQRLAIAFEMSQIACDLALARLRALHPGRSDSELKKVLLRQQFPQDRVPPPLR